MLCSVPAGIQYVVWVAFVFCRSFVYPGAERSSSYENRKPEIRRRSWNTDRLFPVMRGLTFCRKYDKFFR